MPKYRATSDFYPYIGHLVDSTGKKVEEPQGQYIIPAAARAIMSKISVASNLQTVDIIKPALMA